MQSASASRALPRLRLQPQSGWLASAILTVLLVYTIAQSTVRAQWVPGSAAVTPLALIAALLMGGLAMARFVPWPAALLAGGALAPVAAWTATAPTLGVHPGDATGPFALIQTWTVRLLAGDTLGVTPFFLFLLCLLFWGVGGWLAWCVLRWRQPLLGLVPGAAAFATTLLNFPDEQNGYMLFFLVLTLALLLWTHYQRSVDEARSLSVRLSSDASWDFWEMGVAVTAMVVVLGIFLPPLSGVDRSVDIESGVFRNWAELQQQLNHPVPFGRGTAAGTSIGFSPNVSLGGPLQRGGGVVFMYQLSGDFAGPRYFRGTNEVRTVNGEWRYQPSAGDPNVGTAWPIDRDQVPPYSEPYHGLGLGNLTVQMLKPPKNNTDVIFYPGELYKVDRPAVARTVLGVGAAPAVPGVTTIDRLSGVRIGGTGQYKLQVVYSLATEDDLRSAGTDYPAWLDPYRNFAGLYRRPGDSSAPDPLTRGGTYRPAATLNRIHQLALQVTQGKTNPYDQAQAIESYLRSGYSYTLSPPAPPRDVDPIDFFLFTSKQGYCEYFATAMGDMLRSLGVPVRLVNGFGPGSYDDHVQRYVVKESDAHTWVEVYFPSFGWIPFEPTPDGTYFPVARGSSGTAVCARDSEICVTGTEGAADTAGGAGKADRQLLDPGAQGLPIGGGGVAGSNLVGFLGILLALAGLTFAAVLRYLRPSTAGGAWKRVSLLARLAGLGRKPGETPLEFGRRLGAEAPELGAPALRMAEAYAAAAYAPPELAASSRSRVLDAYVELRPLLLGRIRERNRFA